MPARRVPHVGVEGSEWLVEQEETGAEDQRPSESDPLPLTAGELARSSPREGSQSDCFEHFGHHAPLLSR